MAYKLSHFNSKGHHRNLPNVREGQRDDPLDALTEGSGPEKNRPMEKSQDYPIDRVLFETTEFCENQCYFCYGDYGPQGKHMSSERFSLYLKNLIEADLLAPDSLLILFGGEILNHPQCLEICRVAAEIKKPTMHLVIITSDKFRDEFRNQVEELVDRGGIFHHWEVSIKDIERFQFGIELLERGHEVLFRYDYLNPTNHPFQGGTSCML